LLRRILYVSRAAESVTEPALRQIIATAQMKNRRRDLSGVLAVGNGLFAQVLEGSKEDVGETLERIRSDNRHDDVRLVSDCTTSTRIFDRWSMALLVEETAADLAQAVRDGGREATELITHLRDQLARDPLYWSPGMGTLALAT
jgi:hypothetical protein